MGIIIVIGVGITAFVIYRVICMFSLKHKFSNFVNYCNLYNYSFVGYYEKIGLEYRKKLATYEIANLFKDWNVNPIAFPENSSIIEHLVVVDFPSYEINYSPIIENHGGIRLFHFFSIFVKVGKEYQHLPYEKRYIGDFKGKYFNHVRSMTGGALDCHIKWSTKDALLELVKDAKYWNGGEKVIDKYQHLIQLFKFTHKGFSIYDRTPSKVELEDWDGNNHVTVTLSQEYEKNNVDKRIVVTILRREGSNYFQVEKDFKGDEDQNVVFYSFNNECIKEKVKQENHYDDDFMRNIKLPTNRLLTQADIIDAIWEYSVMRSSPDNILNSIKEENTKPSLIPLKDFEKDKGTLEVGCVVNDYDGDYFDICVCTDKEGSRLYIGFSTYLGKISYSKVKKMRDKLYIRYDGEGGYFLCTQESEEIYRTDDMESQERHYLEYDSIFSVLNQLNVKGKEGDYTFTNEKDFYKS